jgi:hypothetical protein
MKEEVEGKQEMGMDIGPLEKVRYQDDQIHKALAMDHQPYFPTPDLFLTRDHWRHRQQDQPSGHCEPSTSCSTASVSVGLWTRSR